ncbi:hypothetical protein [Paenibacillus azoreducens]|uniref:Uncharacterized protein n=2 Tax=Paenibacillus azoreducens TaxID=116718 RepID=A0A920CRM2_9BACL|nr:hypothetical protein [Paenibacillus azoreducens]GIO46437.1 hypothetical protein J34TS1_12020 [Paenibacillus azoreducens]
MPGVRWTDPNGHDSFNMIILRTGPMRKTTPTAGHAYEYDIARASCRSVPEITFQKNWRSVCPLVPQSPARTMPSVPAALPQPTLRTSLQSQGIVTLQKQASKTRYVQHTLYVSPVKRGSGIEIIEDILPVYQISVLIM